MAATVPLLRAHSRVQNATYGIYGRAAFDTVTQVTASKAPAAEGSLDDDRPLRRHQICGHRWRHYVADRGWSAARMSVTRVTAIRKASHAER